MTVRRVPNKSQIDEYFCRKKVVEEEFGKDLEMGLSRFQSEKRRNGFWLSAIRKAETHHVNFWIFEAKSTSLNVFHLCPCFLGLLC